MIEGGTMKWNKLNSVDQLDAIKRESESKPVLIFKHSTRCNISKTSLDRLERNWKEDEMSDVSLYFVDLLSYRDVSNQIAQVFGVEHESPQVLIIRNGQSTYDQSHFQIDYQSIKDAVKS